MLDGDGERETKEHVFLVRADDTVFIKFYFANIFPCICIKNDRVYKSIQMKDAAGEVRTNSSVTFFKGPRQIEVPVLAD